MVIYELFVVIVSLFRDINSDKGYIVEIDVVDIVFKYHKVPIVVRGCLDCKVLEGDAVGIVEFYCGILGVSGIACQDNLLVVLSCTSEYHTVRFGGAGYFAYHDEFLIRSGRHLDDNFA